MVLPKRAKQSKKWFDCDLILQNEGCNFAVLKSFKYHVDSTATEKPLLCVCDYNLATSVYHHFLPVVCYTVLVIQEDKFT